MLNIVSIEEIENNSSGSKIMKRLQCIFYTVIFVFLVGCSATGSMKIKDISKNDTLGEDISEVLQLLETDGFNCTRMPNLELDERLIVVTDGTLRDLEFHTCHYEEETVSRLCISRTRVHVVSQYGKVVRISDAYDSKSCVYD